MISVKRNELGRRPPLASACRHRADLRPTIGFKEPMFGKVVPLGWNYRPRPPQGHASGRLESSIRSRIQGERPFQTRRFGHRIERAAMLAVGGGLLIRALDHSVRCHDDAGQFDPGSSPLGRCQGRRSRKQARLASRPGPPTPRADLRGSGSWCAAAPKSWSNLAWKRRRPFPSRRRPSIVRPPFGR